jgi:hypothetical protein
MAGMGRRARRRTGGALPLLDYFTASGHEDVAGFVAEHRDFGTSARERAHIRSGDFRGKMREGLALGKRPDRSLEAVGGGAGRADGLLALLIVETLGSSVHSCLAAKGFPQGNRPEISF